MKGTEVFKRTIKAYLDNLAEEDPLFADKYKNDKKNIDDCITYILNTVQKTGCNGFTDDEIYGMAVHYYDEESIDIGKEITCRVAVNHTVELTEEEKKQVYEKAIEKYEKECRDKIIEQKKKRSEKQQEVAQLSLF